MDELELPVCTACGACCLSDLPTYVRLDGDDHARLGEAVDDVAHWVGNRCYLRMTDGACAQLRVASSGPRFTCAVYADRPATCRTLERGSPACLAERATKLGRAHARATAADAPP